MGWLFRRTDPRRWGLFPGLLRLRSSGKKDEDARLDFTSTSLSDSDVEIVLAVYADNAEHGRHHESERSTFANIVVAGSAAIIVLIASEHFRADLWWLPLLIVGLAVYGFLMSTKSYERFCLHRERLRACRRLLELARPNARLTRINEIAEQRHRAGWIGRQDLHTIWHRFNVTIIVAALVLAGVMFLSEFIGGPFCRVVPNSAMCPATDGNHEAMQRRAVVASRPAI